MVNFSIKIKINKSLFYSKSYSRSCESIKTNTRRKNRQSARNIRKTGLERVEIFFWSIFMEMLHFYSNFVYKWCISIFIFIKMLFLFNHWFKISKARWFNYSKSWSVIFLSPTFSQCSTWLQLSPNQSIHYHCFFVFFYLADEIHKIKQS